MSKPSDTIYRGDLKPEQVARAQQLRCCEAQLTGNQEVYAGAVLALLGVVPPDVRYAVEDAQEEAAEKIKKIVEELRQTITAENPPNDETLAHIVSEIMAVKNSTYVDEVEKWEYESPNGMKLGTPETPFYRNNPTDDNYDPTLNGGKPILASPIRHIEPEVNYYRLFTRINEEMTNYGIGWEQEHTKERENI